MAIAGDERAFAKVIRTYRRAILAKIRRFLYLYDLYARDLIVDDIYQAVLLRVWRYWRAAKPDPPRSPRAWLMRVTLTVCSDELRKETRGPKVVSLDDNKDIRDPGEDSFLTTAPDPLSESVREAMRRLLSEQEFRATSMCYLEGLSYEDAARREGCTPRQLRYRVQTALAKLRADLNPK
jgi:RNA polymerase sigma factor (sigma-70 family)